MRVLIYGAGVIGSLYAVLLAEAGIETAVYARGKRLESLQKYGLQYKKGNRIRTVRVPILAELKPSDRYDYILLAVREHQLLTALDELRENISPTIVTMANSLDSYDDWERICGKGRILPAFPGAGGGFDGEVLDAALTPRIIQPTTIGRTDGRERKLSALFRKAGIPCQIVEDMHAWQICHLAMVVPIADAYYASADPENAGRDRKLMRKTAVQIRRNMKYISSNGMRLSPAKMNLLRYCPSAVTSVILGLVFRSDFGNRFMYQHSMKAPDEMRNLHKQFYGYLRETRGGR